jgi:hypothetical protein
MKKLLLLAAVALSLSACKKDEDKTPSISRTDLLVDKDWILKDQIETFGSTTTSVYSKVDACAQDNFLRFTKPNLVVRNEGTLKCNTTDPQVKNGTWAFSGDDAKLTIDSEAYNVTELTDGSMKLSATLVKVGTTSAGTFTLVYAKK